MQGRSSRTGSSGSGSSGPQVIFTRVLEAPWTVHADIVDLEPRREPRPGRTTAVPPADGEAEEEVVRLAQRVGRAAGAVESRVKGRGVEEQGIDVQPDL